MLYKIIHWFINPKANNKKYRQGPEHLNKFEIVLKFLAILNLLRPT